MKTTLAVTGEGTVDVLIAEMKCDARWEQATAEEMREWATVEISGTDEQRAEHRLIEESM